MFIGGFAREECWEKGRHRGRLRCPSSKEQRRSPAAGEASGATQRAQTPRVMAEKTNEENQLWNGTILQDASVSELSLQGEGRAKLTFLSYHRVSPNLPPGLQVEWKWGNKAQSPQCWRAERDTFRGQEAGVVTSH